MITIALWKWRKIPTGYQLPAPGYSADHVNIACRMIRRNTTVPHRIVCVTDDPRGIYECDTVAMPKPYKAGGCYHRLWEFSDEFRKVAGDRFIRFDLDMIITGNIDHILADQAPFRINRYMLADRPHQRYNGALVLMDTGCRSQVWSDFDARTSPRLIEVARERKTLVGTDQAWIRHILGPDEMTFGPEHGVYEYSVIGSRLPEDAKVVFFAGARDPSRTAHKWVRQAWK